MYYNHGVAMPFINEKRKMKIPVFLSLVTVMGCQVPKPTLLSNQLAMLTTLIADCWM